MGNRNASVTCISCLFLFVVFEVEVMASEEEAAADRRKTLPPVEVLFLPDGLHYDYAEMPQKKYRRTRVTSPQDSSRSATAPPTTLVNRCKKGDSKTLTSIDGDRGVVQPVPCAQYETQTFTECHAMPYEEVQDPDLLVYCNLVKQYSACVPVNSSMVEFVVKDFDMVKKELVDKYLCIQRRMLFLESKSLHFWVYACSCTPQSLPLLNAVARNIGSPESEQDVISELEHNCLHTAALKNILFSVNCQDELSSGPEDEGNTICSDTNDYLFEVDATMPVVGVHADGTSAVIGLDRSRLKCLTCPSVKTCSHAIYLSLLLNEDGESCVTWEVQGLHNLILARASGCDKPVTGTVQSTAALVSNKPIGVLPRKEAKAMLPHSLEDSMVHLKPPGTVCPSCNTDMTPIADGVFPLFSFQSIEAAKVHRLTCVNCNNSISYEGNEDGILYLRHHLITHSLLRDYMYHFVHGRSSMYRYYRVWCSRQAEVEDPMAIDFQQKMSYGHFRAAWYSFMSLLDIQYEEGFQCPHCGPAPSVVVGDATTLAYRQCYDSWTKAVSCTEDRTEYVSQPIMHGSSYSQRVFLEDAKTRKLLRKFCKNVENTDFTSLPALLLVCPPLCRILDKYGTPSLGDAPQGLRMFLLELSSSSSACAWIPPSGRSVLVLDKIINGMAIRGDALDMKILQEDMPIIFRLITDVPIDADIIEILKRLKQVSQRPFKQHTQLPLECSTEKNMDVAYFPSLPVVRRRGIYTIDRKQKPDGCRKNSSRHPTLLPGIFTLFCQHGILTPNGTVSLDCGSQQTFTCSVTSPAAGWTITGLSNITAVDSSGLSAASNNARITTTDTSGIAPTSTITITGFTTADNGGTVQCINLSNVLVEGMATMSVGAPDCPIDVNVVEGDLCDSVNVTWTSSPSQTSATIIYCQVSSQGSCMSVVCSSSPCTIQGVLRDREYEYTVLPTNNFGSASGCTGNMSVTFALAKCNVCTTPQSASIIPTAVAAVVPSVVLILVNIVSVVFVFFLTRHSYKNTSKTNSPVKCAYHQVQGGKAYEFEDMYIKMTDNPAYRPIK